MYLLKLVFKCARLLATPRSSSCCIDFSLIYPKNILRDVSFISGKKTTCCFELL